MTVGELKKILEELPDDMFVLAHDSNGDQEWEYLSVKVITHDEPRDPRWDWQPPRPYLKIAS